MAGVPPPHAMPQEIGGDGAPPHKIPKALGSPFSLWPGDTGIKPQVAPDFIPIDASGMGAGGRSQPQQGDTPLPESMLNAFWGGAISAETHLVGRRTSMGGATAMGVALEPQGWTPQATWGQPELKRKDAALLKDTVGAGAGAGDAKAVTKRVARRQGRKSHGFRRARTEQNDAVIPLVTPQPSPEASNSVPPLSVRREQSTGLSAGLTASLALTDLPEASQPIAGAPGAPERASSGPSGESAGEEVRLAFGGSAIDAATLDALLSDEYVSDEQTGAQAAGASGTATHHAKAPSAHMVAIAPEGQDGPVWSGGLQKQSDRETFDVPDDAHGLLTALVGDWPPAAHEGGVALSDGVTISFDAADVRALLEGGDDDH